MKCSPTGMPHAAAAAPRPAPVRSAGTLYRGMEAGHDSSSEAALNFARLGVDPDIDHAESHAPTREHAEELPGRIGQADNRQQRRYHHVSGHWTIRRGGSTEAKPPRRWRALPRSHRPRVQVAPSRDFQATSAAWRRPLEFAQPSWQWWRRGERMRRSSLRVHGASRSAFSRTWSTLGIGRLEAEPEDCFRAGFGNQALDRRKWADVPECHRSELRGVRDCNSPAS